MSILVSGSLAYDHIMNFPDSFKNHIMPEQLHILNVCFMVDKLNRNWGGTAGNIAFTIKLLGQEPTIVSAVGKDGRDYLEYFKKLNISADHISVDNNRNTASAYITTDQDDNQIIAFYNGPLENAPSLAAVTIKPAIVIIAPTNKDTMIKHLNEAADLGAVVVFDPGQQITAFSDIELKKLISRANFVIGNDYEIKLLEERTGWSGQEILEQTKVLITTLGERGSVVSTREGEVIEIAACAPKSFDDPTGAGDAYRAGFFVGLNQKQPLKVCAQMGSVAASYAIETYGTQEHQFTIKEFADRYQKTYGENYPLKF